jgi:hypothetical protein
MEVDTICAKICTKNDLWKEDKITLRMKGNGEDWVNIVYLNSSRIIFSTNFSTNGIYLHFFGRFNFPFFRDFFSFRNAITIIISDIPGSYVSCYLTFPWFLFAVFLSHYAIYF